MSEIAHWFSIMSASIALPAMAILAVFFYLKNKNINNLIFAIGVILMVGGQAAMIFFPYGTVTLDKFQKIMKSSGPDIGWYFGNIVFSIGLLVTVLGFALITFKSKSTS